MTRRQNVLLAPLRLGKPGLHRAVALVFLHCFTGCLLATALNAQDEPCRSFLREMNAMPEITPDGYKKRTTYGDEEYRCEGFFKPATSGPKAQLSVVSLTLGALDYTASSDLRFEVVVSPGLSLDSATVVDVTALPTSEGADYQMDARFPVSGRLLWPAGEMLAERGLPAEKLGIFGKTSMGNSIVYVPVLARQEGSTTKAGTEVRLKLRFPYRLSKLGWKVGTFDEKGECISGDGFRWMRALKGREPIPIRLDSSFRGDCLIFKIKRTRSETSQHQKIGIALPGDSK